MKLTWLLGGGIVVAFALYLADAKLGGPSPTVKALMALKAGDAFPAKREEKDLLPHHFAERKWEVESWTVVPNGRCTAIGGVLVDRAQPPESPLAHVAATALACRGRLLSVGEPESGPFVWITPHFGGEGPVSVEHQLRFAEALGPAESVAWSTSAFTVRQKDAVQSLQVVEEGFRERDGRLERVLFVRSVNDAKQAREERNLSLEGYRCAFEGDAFPRPFRCTYRGRTTGAAWDEGTGAWVERSLR